MEVVEILAFASYASQSMEWTRYVRTYATKRDEDKFASLLKTKLRLLNLAAQNPTLRDLALCCVFSVWRGDTGSGQAAGNLAAIKDLGYEEMVAIRDLVRLNYRKHEPVGSRFHRCLVHCITMMVKNALLGVEYDEAVPNVMLSVHDLPRPKPDAEHSLAILDAATYYSKATSTHVVAPTFIDLD
eukprot:g15776.t1